MNYRRALTWCLWSPRRLVLVVGVALVLLVAIGSHVGGGSSASHPQSRGGGGPTTTAGRPPTRSALASPTLRPKATTAAPASLSSGARAAAVAFVDLWARPGVAEAQWYAALQPLATKSYAAQLADKQPWSVPADRVTGSPSGSAHGTSATVTVPTNSGPVTVLLEEQGASWLVSDVET